MKILEGRNADDPAWKPAAEELLAYPGLSPDVLAEIWREALGNDSELAQKVMARLKQLPDMQAVIRVFEDSCEDKHYKGEPKKILAALEEMGGDGVLTRALKQYADTDQTEELQDLLAAMLRFATVYDKGYTKQKGVSILAGIPGLGQAAVEPLLELLQKEEESKVAALIPPILAKIGGEEMKEDLWTSLQMSRERNTDGGETDGTVSMISMDNTVDIAIYEALAEMDPVNTAIELADIYWDHDASDEMKATAARLLEKIRGPQWRQTLPVYAGLQTKRRHRYIPPPEIAPAGQAPERMRDQPGLETTLQEVRETVSTSL